MIFLASLQRNDPTSYPSSIHHHKKHSKFTMYRCWMNLPLGSNFPCSYHLLCPSCYLHSDLGLNGMLRTKLALGCWTLLSAVVRMSSNLPWMQSTFTLILLTPSCRIWKPWPCTSSSYFGLESAWEVGSEEYNWYKDEVTLGKYCKALGKLKRLVVMCLFELAKLLMSGAGQ